LNESGIAIPSVRLKLVLFEVLPHTIELEQSCAFGAGEQKKVYAPALAEYPSLSVCRHAQAG